MNDGFKPPLASEVKVDMLFVVDDSGSMAEEQNLLAKNFGAFIEEFLKKGIDFRIGIISTDVYYQGGGRLKKTKGERWLSRDSSKLVSRFTETIKLGTTGDDKEQGLNAVLKATAPGMLGAGGFNDGFLRSDALFSAIIVSDEDEDIIADEISNDRTPEGRIDRVVKRLSDLKLEGSRGYRFDFVVDLNASKPKAISYPLGSDINSYPNVYLKAALRFSAKTININNDFGNDLVEIGSDIIHQAQSEFKLTKHAILGSIKVTLNGEVVPENTNDGFVFHEDRNTIELRGSFLAKSPGSNLKLTYFQK